MRISTTYQYENSLRDLAAAQERYVVAQGRVSSGKRIERMSDDWVGASLALNLRGYRSAIEQYQKNMVTGKGYLGFTEGALSEAAGLIRRAYELAVQGANGPTDQPGRDAMHREAVQIQSSLLAIANTRGPQGEYIFAGQATNAQPFTISGSSLVFSGNNLDVVVEIGPNQTIAANTPGETLFTDAWNALESLKANLQGGNPGAIGGIDIPALQAVRKAFDDARGTVGSRLRTIDQTGVQHARRADELTARISDVEDVDLSAAVVEYRLAETAYQAALSAAAQSFRLSLVDFIRG